MNESTQSLAQVKDELLEKIDGVDRKVDSVDRKVDAVRVELLEKIDGVDRKVDGVDRKVDATNLLVTATATALEHRIDKKLDHMEERMMKAVEAVVDQTVQRVVGTVREWSRYDAAVVDDKLKSIERKLDEHVSNEIIHTHGATRR